MLRSAFERIRRVLETFWTKPHLRVSVPIWYTKTEGQSVSYGGKEHIVSTIFELNGRRLRINSLQRSSISNIRVGYKRY